MPDVWKDLPSQLSNKPDAIAGRGCLCPVNSTDQSTENAGLEKSDSMKEICVLAECQRVHYNTVRAHFALGYRPPWPAKWLTEIPRGHEKTESTKCFALSHTSDCGYHVNPITALH
jgi:hypothetical protein